MASREVSASIGIGWLLLGLAALSGCSLGADTHGGSSPITAGAGGSTDAPAETSPAAPMREPEASPAERPAELGGGNQLALDELENAGCASGCNVAGQEHAPALPGQAECSTQLEWASPGWVEVEMGMGSGAKLAADSLGNMYFAGTFTGDHTLGPFSVQSPGQATGFVMKLGPDCTPIWLKELKGNVDARVDLSTLAIDRDDNLIVGGTLSGTADFGQGPITTENAYETGERGSFALVLKLDSDGELLWNRMLSSKYTGTWVYDLAVGATGDIVVSGMGGPSVRFVGTPEPVAPPPGGASTMYVAFLSASGEPGPIHMLYGEDAYGSVAVDSTGRVAISGFVFDGGGTGPFAGYAWSPDFYDHFLIMLDPSGALELGRTLELVTLEDLNGLLGYALAFDRSDNLIIEHGRTTYYDDGTHTHHPQTLLKVAPDGTEAWSLTSQYGGPGGLGWMKEVATDAHDNIVHVDELVPDITIDGATFEVRGARDILVYKREPSGALLWSTQLGGDGDDIIWGLATDRDDAAWVGIIAHEEDFRSGSVTITKLAP